MHMRRNAHPLWAMIMMWRVSIYSRLWLTETSIHKNIQYHSDTVTQVAVVADDMDGVRPAMSPWIATLWVDPRHRRRGIATRLLQEALRVAKGAAKSGQVGWSDADLIEFPFVALLCALLKFTCLHVCVCVCVCVCVYM